MADANKRPWYREFWLWFVFAPPMASIVLGLSLLGTAIINADSMVVDDYYQVGRALHRTQGKEIRAATMGLNGQLVLDREHGAITLRLQGNQELPETLSLELSHATHASRDMELTLQRDSTGLYRADAQRPISGRYYLRLASEADGWLIVRDMDPEQRELSLDTGSGDDA